MIFTIDCYLSVVERFLRAMLSEFSTPLRATHGGKVQGDKQIKCNPTNVPKPVV